MALNLNGWVPLGAVALTAAPQTIPTLYPIVANQQNSVALFRVQSHEENAPGTLIYIGDNTLGGAGGGAGYVLQGPLQVFDIENQNAQNTLDLDQFSLFSKPTGGKVRVSILGC
jgi:hypothetical protein